MPGQFVIRKTFTSVVRYQQFAGGSTVGLKPGTEQ